MNKVVQPLSSAPPPSSALNETSYSWARYVEQIASHLCSSSHFLWKRNSRWRWNGWEGGCYIRTSKIGQTDRLWLTDCWDSDWRLHLPRGLIFEWVAVRGRSHFVLSFASWGLFWRRACFLLPSFSSGVNKQEMRMYSVNISRGIQRNFMGMLEYYEWTKFSRSNLWVGWRHPTPYQYRRIRVKG